MSITDTRNHTLLALLLLTALIIGKSAYGYPTGGDAPDAGEDWANDVMENGCACHTDQQLDEGTYMLEGMPAKYTPNTVYNISLSINDKNVISGENVSRYGGFLATTSEGAFISDKNYWVSSEGNYISHNDNSNIVRNWTFQWTAPSEGTGDALFTIYFNVVDGIGSTGDQWSYLTAVSLGTPQTGFEKVSIHELCVELMQYWIGLIGLAVVLLSVLIAYVVIRGGSANYRG